MKWPNPVASVAAPIARLLASEYPWRRATEPRCYAL